MGGFFTEDPVFRRRNSFGLLYAGVSAPVGYMFKTTYLDLTLLNLIFLAQLDFAK